jgi:CPA2 family monovalent cation:H+ antiporter-2
VLRLPWSQAFIIGVVLAQLGEFAFLLSTVGHETHIINDFGEKLIIALTVLSLALSPLWLAVARHLHNFADSATINLPGIINLLCSREAGILRRVARKPVPKADHEVKLKNKDGHHKT